MFVAWGRKQGEQTSRGVLRKKFPMAQRALRNDESRPNQIGEDGMKETAKKVASSSALAHALAMTAMLIIASCIFYIR